MKNDSKYFSDIPILLFRTTKQWLAWLEKNHAKSSGIWLRIAKKGSTKKSISYDEALEGALCYGWIDAQKQSFDAELWLQIFRPRGPRSMWSKINRERVEALIKEDRMRSPGMQAVEQARENGQWDAAYDSQSRIQIPDDLLHEFAEHPRAREFFEGLNSVNRYAILYRIQTARKAETRTKRIQQFVEMLERGEKIYP